MAIYIAKNNQQTGPFTEEQIIAGVKEKLFFPTDLAWQEGMAGWQPLSSVLPAAFGNVVPPSLPAVQLNPAAIAALTNPPAPGTSGLAITSLITGLVGLVFWPFGGLAAVITGHMAKSEIRKSAGATGGSGMAVAGLVLGYLGLFLWPALIVAFMVFAVSSEPRRSSFYPARSHEDADGSDGTSDPGRPGQAKRVLQDLRLLDSAIDQYAIETNKTSGFNATFGDLKNYLKSGTPLYNTGADVFGNPYGPFTVDSIPKVPEATFNTLSDVADDSFWSPYR